RDGSAACGIYQVAGCRYEGRMSSKIRTIIVDDEALSRRGLEIRLLGTQDFEIVSQCANAREAIAAISTHQPDLVFLDIQMPGMSGFDLLSHLPTESLP